MGDIIEAFMKFIRVLLGGGNGTTTPATSTKNNTSSTTSNDSEACALGAFEIPSETPIEAPLLETTAQAMSAFGADASFIAQSAGCYATVRPELGRVYLRLGPRIEFDIMAQTQGGVVFPLVGASEADTDGHRWFNLMVGAQSGWIRGDLITLSEDCLSLTYVNEDDLNRPAPPSPEPPSSLFPAPADVPITTGYSGSHKGLDLATPMDTPIRAVTDGVVIRRVDCELCDGNKPNIFPCGNSVYSNIKWGYGYGNFIVIRHDYATMPASLRATMDSKGLTNGFVYVLYAHFSRNNVSVGQWVSGGHVLGLTGNHGCSTGPHLHFEVKIGRDEMVDGRWQQQTPINPKLMFDM
jgi:hypothetical protein